MKKKPNNIVIISFYEPQYIYFYENYIKNKYSNITYYFYDKPKNNSYGFLKNMRIAIQNKKYLSLLSFYI